jgi:AcrR family transcriptional regulator
MASNRAELKKQTREALIDAGMVLIGTQGLDVSLDAICKRAGFTRGAFYVHFRDRDDFLVAVMDRVGLKFIDAMVAADPGTVHDELSRTIRRFTQAVVAGGYPLARKGGVRPHQLIDACMRAPVIRERYVALIDECRRRLERVARDGQRSEFVRPDVQGRDLALLLMTVVIGAQTLLELEASIDVAKLADLLVLLITKPGKG